MRRRSLPLLALVLCLARPAASTADQTDDYVRGQMRSQHIPGLSLVVLKDGEIVKAAGYGLADRKQEIPATPQTVYKIGSVSKQFIAAGIMLLVQEKRLGLDDPVGKFLVGTPAAWNPITVRHLLTHTSGLVREAPGFDPSRIQRDADVIHSMYPLPLQAAPGEKWEYSNAGYFVLGEIIRVVSGRPWSEYLKERVFTPSGMTATRPNTSENFPNQARGYNDNHRLLDAPDWPAVRPSGGFLSTVLDLAKWDHVLSSDKILTDSTRRQMWTPVILNDGTSFPYGMGWKLDPMRGHRQVYHVGGLWGFLSEFTRLVDDHVSIIVLMNLDDADVQSIAQDVASFYLPASVRTASRESPPGR